MENYKKIIITAISMVIKHEPIKLARLVRTYIKDNFLHEGEILENNDVKLIFTDQSTVVFDKSGNIVLKTFKGE